MGMMGYGGFGGGGLLMGFLGPVFWLLIIAGIILLVRYLWPTVGATAGREREGSALEILRERYARGEIDQEEFTRRKQDLK